LVLSYSLVHNPTPVLDAFIESPILVRKKPELSWLEMSAFMLRKDAVVLGLEMAAEPASEGDWNGA
jgi:hypothetical protein